MTGKERLIATLNHTQPDRVCVDMGATAVTGISASALTKLRRAVLGEEEYRVHVHEPYQMLGDVDDALREALGIDVADVPAPRTMFGFVNRDWKPFTMFDGTEVLVSEEFRTRENENGDLLIFPEGDTSAPPSGKMPKGGFYFDSIIRQEPIDEDKLDPADNCEEFQPLNDGQVQYFADQSAARAGRGDYGVVIGLPGTALGDIALVPGPFMKHPRGIRDVAEWYISTAARKDYVHAVFERQTDIAVANIARLAEAVGDLVQVAFICGTDFGTQRAPFISPQAYKELYSPYYKRINAAVHEHTNWKTFKHSCGSIFELIPLMIEDGFDILNPVQCSAANMDPRDLKREFGKEIVFWGGGVDTQKTLPFGTPEDVYREVRERIQIFNDSGGFVFNTIHNIQANSPLENLQAMFRAIKDSGK
jgi:hypothetical protein